MSSDLFADWYDRTATVTIPGGTDEWGAQLPGTDVQVPCRITEQVTLVRSGNGEQVASNVTLHAALEWADKFKLDAPVAFDSPAGARERHVITLTVNIGDPDLEGITVYLT